MYMQLGRRRYTRSAIRNIVNKETCNLFCAIAATKNMETRSQQVAQSGLVWERFREWGKYSGEIIINVTSDDTGCSIFTVQRDTHHASMNNPVTLLPVYDGKGAAKTWLRLRVLVEMAVAGINCAFQALVEMRDEGFRRSRELPSAPACTSVARLEGKLFTDHDSIACIHHCDEFVRSGEVGSRSSGIWMVKEIPAHYSKFLFSEEGLLEFILGKPEDFSCESSNWRFESRPLYLGVLIVNDIESIRI
ncbi:MAG: hypothetical protein NXY57DRAFT_1040884 [Lentinula lateritia]|nr:MAG: hypothetical protein NXY57DRAFT_1040884 [Lentinula lateritia]